MLVDEDLLRPSRRWRASFRTVRAYVIMSEKKDRSPTSSPRSSRTRRFSRGDGELRLASAALTKIRWRRSATPPPPQENRRGSVLPPGDLPPRPCRSARADVLGIREADAVMPVVPMFHVNAWASVRRGRGWDETGVPGLPARREGAPFIDSGREGDDHRGESPRLDGVLQLMERESTTSRA